MTTITQNGGVLEIQQVAGVFQYKNATESSWNNVSSFPVTIVNGTPTLNTKLTVNFTSNLEMTTANHFFVCDSSCIIFDGLSNTVTIKGVSNYPGLIQNGTTIINGYDSITIQNIITARLNSSSLAANAGYICQQYFGKNIKNVPGLNQSTNYILITNCSNTGIINGASSGGICGKFFCYNGVGTINNCSNSGSLNNGEVGGICGESVSSNSGTVNITNCVNTGAFSYGSFSGGICGSNAATNAGSLTITNCTNNANITASYSGGILSRLAGSLSGIIVIRNCSNTGTIGLQSGGIVGQRGSGSISIYNCYNSGSISVNYAGGIVGYGFSYNTNLTSTISDCYSTGSIGGTYSGGICGGGMAFSDNGLTPTVNILNCYTLGNIATNCGGIIGGQSQAAYNNSYAVSLSNCYSHGVITSGGSGLIENSLQIKNMINLTNCYVSNGSWTDAAANASLTGTPSSVSSPGTVWMSLNADTPYILMAYNQPIYDPSSLAISTTDYDSPSGLFQPDYTYAIVNTDADNAIGVSINASTGVLSFIGIPFGTSIVTRIVVCKFDSSNYPYDMNINTFSLAYSICFKEDSKILCFVNNEEMYIKVQDIRPGMLVKIYDEGYVEVDTIGWFNLDNAVNDNRNPDGLYELTTEDYPELTENLVLTGRHSILVDDVNKEQLNKYHFSKNMRVCDKFKLPCFANGKAKVYEETGIFKIWSFCLKSDDETQNFGIYANGLLVESTNKKDINRYNLNCV
jgi:hypothetical protein